ncbi:MAG: hypothetical protein R6T96_06830 [Longimicrobiales bacterium]
MIVSVPQDDQREIWYANRLLVLLYPREPFMVWAQQFREPGEPPAEFRAAMEQPVPFMVPILDDQGIMWEWVQENYVLFFDTALWSWVPEQNRWPEDRGWEAFQEWFELEFLGAPWDIVAEPLHSTPPPREPVDWD